MLFNNCQERCISRCFPLFSCILFLWFGSIGASCLDSEPCTHCSWKHVKQRVSRVSIKLQTGTETRRPARVAREDGVKGQ